MRSNVEETMGRRFILICTLGAVAGIFVIPLNPVNSRILKLALVMCALGSLAGFTILTWKSKPMRIALLMVPVLIAILCGLPGKSIDAIELRADYLQRLVQFEGTKYHWGGESLRGVDCSGLPRRAFRDALLAYGIRHLNGQAIRAYLEQWWFDASARDLGEGYRDYTRPVGITGTIREMDCKDLLPGDLAVTINGVHALAYAGDGRWIQADPGSQAVVTLDGEIDANGWFRSSVTTHRWKLLVQD